MYFNLSTLATVTKAHPNCQNNLTTIATADKWYIQRHFVYCKMQQNLICSTSCCSLFLLVPILVIFSLCKVQLYLPQEGIFKLKMLDTSMLPLWRPLYSSHFPLYQRWLLLRGSTVCHIYNGPLFTITTWLYSLKNKLVYRFTLVCPDNNKLRLTQKRENSNVYANTCLFLDFQKNFFIFLTVISLIT